MKFKTSFRNCVYKAMNGREWRETDADDWNVMWCEKEQIDWVFEKYRMQPASKVNHFRGWTELCRKDMLSKNLKKFKRALDKQGNSSESNEYDFLPPTFLMPSEYVIFYEEFKKHQHNDKVLWIMKPVLVLPGRPPSARDGASSSSTASARSTAGRAPTRTSRSRTTSASVTSSTPCSSGAASSTCVSTR